MITGNLSDKWTAVVIAEYDTDGYQQGEIISRHRTAEAAERAAKPYRNMRGVRLAVDVWNDRRYRGVKP